MLYMILLQVAANVAELCLALRPPVFPAEIDNLNELLQSRSGIDLVRLCSADTVQQLSSVIAEAVHDIDMHADCTRQTRS